MAASDPVTETAIFKVKEGLRIEKHADQSDSAALESFLGLLRIVGKQEGSLSQYWGHMIEHRDFFVCVMNWKSQEFMTTFTQSEEHGEVLAGFDAIFDLQAFAPVLIFHPYEEGAANAYGSKVTEIAYFTFPTATLEESKAAIKNGVAGESGPNVMELVVTVGKATGAASAWVTSYYPPTAVPDDRSIALYGYFGYDSIEDHMKWRETPEHAAVTKQQEKISEKVDLQPAIVQGLDLSMFHVSFQKQET